ncbi:diaminopropionate ammonia-lyase [Jeotgalibacillus marinus]|uniref:Diaminopropionate ammonia-lyase n=1 Tax=Jeotgalibacillus marinus TaxID=86667 RepID=A0ABV3Q2Y4_9BACL
MFNDINWVSNNFKGKVSTQGSDNFSSTELKKTLQFHSSITGYEPTPLHSLDALAKYLDINKVFVKDESKRFGLNAFKGLGASYAIATYFSQTLSVDLNTVDFNKLGKLAKTLPQVTFATATDGNHGKGVAWAASHFGQKSKVYMPKGSSTARLKAIEALGADACITELNYDDTVQLVADLSSEHDWVLIQDTAWKGYESIPLSIMQGYTTIVSEIHEQLEADTFNEITHVILQAGVGSFAASMAASIYNLISGSMPKILVVEPSNANCLYQSSKNPEGTPQRVYGDLSTMMAGLACGEPNPFAWEILKSLSNYFFSCKDQISAIGMRILGNPIDSDAKIISGESGSVPMGLLHELTKNKKLHQLKNELELDRSAKVLVINTEGDTDPMNYRKVVWK